jgi:hypothetical protein
VEIDGPAFVAVRLLTAGLIVLQGIRLSRAGWSPEPSAAERSLPLQGPWLRLFLAVAGTAALS